VRKPVRALSWLCRITSPAVTTTDPELNPPGIKLPRIGVFGMPQGGGRQAGGELMEPVHGDDDDDDGARRNRPTRDRQQKIDRTEGVGDPPPHTAPHSICPHLKFFLVELWKVGLRIWLNTRWTTANVIVIKTNVELYFDQVPLAEAGQTFEAIDEGKLQQCRHATSAEACGGAILKNRRSIAIRSIRQARTVSAKPVPIIRFSTAQLVMAR
jgi:hypothetical protein